MDLIEQQLLTQAMAGYERSRLKNAVLAALPGLLLPLIAFAVGGRLMASVTLGLAVLASVVWLAWRGQAWGRSVPGGLAAGVFPLGLALAAQHIGHVCTPQGCTSLCVPMCAAGGVIAGAVVSAFARLSPSPRITLGFGAALSLAVGAMGCSCVGSAGMLGMAAGLSASTGLALVIQKIR